MVSAISRHSLGENKHVLSYHGKTDLFQSRCLFMNDLFNRVNLTDTESAPNSGAGYAVTLSL